MKYFVRKVHFFIFCILLTCLLTIFLQNSVFAFEKKDLKKLSIVNLNKSKIYKRITLPQDFFTLGDGDERRINKLEAMFYLKLWVIVRKYHVDIWKTSISDWQTAIFLYERLSLIEEELAMKNKKGDFLLYNFFSATKELRDSELDTFKKIKEAEKSGTITKGFSILLFKILIKEEKLPLILPILQPQDADFFRKLEVSREFYLKRFNTKYGNYSSKLEQEFQIDSNFFLQSINSALQFTLPLEEFKSESEYLYATFIKDTNLYQSLKVQYQTDGIKFAGMLATEVVFFTLEAGELLSDVVDLSPKKLKVAAIYDYAFDSLKDCVSLNEDIKRDEYLLNSLKLHRQILTSIKDGSNRVDNLLKVLELLRSDFIRETPDAESIGALELLKEFLNIYLEHRKRLENYVNFQVKFADKRYKGYLKYGGYLYKLDDLNPLIEKPIEAFIKKEKKAVLPTPCEVYKIYKERETTTKNFLDLLGFKSVPKYTQPLPFYDYNLGGESIDTNLKIKKGKTVEVKASGLISFRTLGDDTSTPEGVKGFEEYSYVRNAPHCSLLVRIKSGNKDTWKFCGKSCSFTANQDGNLEFLVNDKQSFNNSGEYKITVKIK